MIYAVEGVNFCILISPSLTMGLLSSWDTLMISFYPTSQGRLYLSTHKKIMCWKDRKNGITITKQKDGVEKKRKMKKLFQNNTSLKKSPTVKKGGCNIDSASFIWAGCHLPSVGVSVAIDMAASRAARRRTLKNILIHSHNFIQTGDRSERQGRLGAPYNHAWALLVCEELGIINIIKKWACVNPNHLFFILMNTSLRGQARFPTILLPLIQPFQISIHGIGTVMNKKMSFKFNRTKPARDRNGRKFWACREQSNQQLAIMQNTSLEINGRSRQMEYSSLIECALLSSARC